MSFLSTTSSGYRLNTTTHTNTHWWVLQTKSTCFQCWVSIHLFLCDIQEHKFTLNALCQCFHETIYLIFVLQAIQEQMKLHGQEQVSFQDVKVFYALQHLYDIWIAFICGSEPCDLDNVGLWDVMLKVVCSILAEKFCSVDFWPSFKSHVLGLWKRKFNIVTQHQHLCLLRMKSLTWWNLKTPTKSPSRIW